MYRLTKKELVESINIPMLFMRNQLVLTHKVKLSQERMGKKDYYHKEFTYQTKIDGVTQRVSTLRLTHQSILALEHKAKDGGYTEPLIINLSNRRHIYSGFKYFKEKVLDDPDLLVEDKDENVVINPDLAGIIRFAPYGDKVIAFKPLVDEEERVLISICLDLKNALFIPITEAMFMTLISEIKNFNFHLAGLAAITYLQAAESGKFEVEVGTTSLLDFEDENLEPIVNLRTKKKEEDKMNLLKTNQNIKRPSNKW